MTEEEFAVSYQILEGDKGDPPASRRAQCELCGEHILLLEEDTIDRVKTHTLKHKEAAG